MKDSRPLSILCLGGRAYPVRHYPIAIRLRDRKGRAILCVALTPQSGDSSGTTLGVRSVALLHAKCSPYASFGICCTFECTSRKKAGPSSKVQPQNADHTTAPLAFFISKSASPYCTIFIHTIVSKLPLCDKNRTNRWESIIFL